MGDAGVLVDATDPYELAGAVARVRGDQDLRKTLAAAGRQRLEALDLASAGDRGADQILALGG